MFYLTLLLTININFSEIYWVDTIFHTEEIKYKKERSLKWQVNKFFFFFSFLRMWSAFLSSEKQLSHIFEQENWNCFCKSN